MTSVESLKLLGYCFFVIIFVISLAAMLARAQWSGLHRVHCLGGDGRRLGTVTGTGAIRT